LRIDKKDLVAAQNTLKQQVLESNKLQDDLTKRIESLNLTKQGLLTEINQLRVRFGKKEAEMEAIYSWVYRPATLGDWNALLDIGRLHNRIAFEFDIHKDLLLARIEHEKAKVIEAEVNNLIIQSWYNLTTGKYDAYQSAEVLREIKQYEKVKADIQSSIASLADKSTAASHALNNNTRTAEAIKTLAKTFREQKDTIFKNHPEEFNRIGTLLRDEVLNEAAQRGEVITQLIEFYNNLINYKTLTIKKIDTMISVLGAKSQWRGGPQLWKGLKKFAPDMTKFGQYLFDNKVAQNSVLANKKLFTQWVGSYKTTASLIMSTILYLFILFFNILATPALFARDCVFFFKCSQC